jgi:hypothetical protein
MTEITDLTYDKLKTAAITALNGASQITSSLANLNVDEDNNEITQGLQMAQSVVSAAQVYATLALAEATRNPKRPSPVTRSSPGMRGVPVTPINKFQKDVE